MRRSRFLTSLAMTLALPLALAWPMASQAQTNGVSKVRISTTVGDIEAELYADKAPKTVANFLQYVNDKHYDGTIFHRVIAGFMVQGGGFDAQYKEKKTRAPVQHEGRQALAGGLKNTTGTLAMARTNDPQSATAQFFINVVDNAFLDPTPIPDGDPVAKFQYQGRVYENVARAQLLNAPSCSATPFLAKSRPVWMWSKKSATRPRAQAAPSRPMFHARRSSSNPSPC